MIASRRRSPRASVGPRALLLSSVLLAAVAASAACSGEAEDPLDAPRPTHDDLLEFYTTFCTLWLGCVPNPELAFGSVAECAEFQVDYYEQLPTTCLDRVIVFHQCAIDLACDAYPPAIPLQVDLGFYVCKAEREAIMDVDCGGMSAP